MVELSLKDEALDALRENGSALYQAKERLEEVVGSTAFIFDMFPVMPEDFR